MGKIIGCRDAAANPDSDPARGGLCSTVASVAIAIFVGMSVPVGRALFADRKSGAREKTWIGNKLLLFLHFDIDAIDRGVMCFHCKKNAAGVERSRFGFTDVTEGEGGG